MILHEVYGIATIVLARELAQKPFIILISDTTKLHRLEENLGRADIELTKEELDSLIKFYLKLILTKHTSN